MTEKEDVNVKDSWMIRNCTAYDEEYSDCCSMRGRFHQYFIYGKTLDCAQWKRDSNNCYKWTDNKDVEAAAELVNSEKQRRKERLMGHIKNDVWKKRHKPPADWDAPLPEYLQKEYESTYLNVKSKEMKGEAPPTFDIPKLSLCPIM